MWAYERVFYQIFPMGFCGVPFENDGICRGESHSIRKIEEWIPHMRRLGVGGLYLSPIFDSDSHGYNTRDYRKIDGRLGTNEDFAQVVKSLHEAGIKVILDGVFNHVGRGFWAFCDVVEKRECSPYLDWFHRIDLNGNSSYDDGLWYEGWEGHDSMVKLNLKNPQVSEYLLDSVKGWIEEFDIDGLRLDVAYSLDEEFMRELRRRTEGWKHDFFLLGEMIHGDYNRLMKEDMLHSVTNYECYKGLHSSMNSANLFELGHSLQRQFGPENWTLYKGKHPVSFVDNHDVERIASLLQDKRHLPMIYALAFGMPGIPCIYYGSEWGIEGRKGDRDIHLRPNLQEPEWNGLSDWIGKLAKAKRGSHALNYGDYRQVLLTNRQCIFERKTEEERVLVAVNMDESAFTAHFDAGCGRAIDLISGQEHDFGGGSILPGFSAYFWRMER